MSMVESSRQTETLTMEPRPPAAEATGEDAVPLDCLKAGQRGCIQRIRHSGAVTRRIMDMGLVKGVQITVVKLAPLGDPMEIKAKGYNLSLRRSEAATILVKRESQS
jgi:ferrous iron transport protein A